MVSSFLTVLSGPATPDPDVASRNMTGMIALDIFPGTPLPDNLPYADPPNSYLLSDLEARCIGESDGDGVRGPGDPHREAFY